jgi:hypothetical protein
MGWLATTVATVCGLVKGDQEMMMSEEDFEVITLMTKFFDEVCEAVCSCVTAAGLLTRGSDPDLLNALENHIRNEPDEEDRDYDIRFSTVATGFFELAERLMRAERMFSSVRQPIRELHQHPPEPIGTVSGPSYHDMGMRFAEEVFRQLELAAVTARAVSTTWCLPIRRATEEQIRERAIRFGQAAGVILPHFYQSATRCDEQRLRDCIETESANAVKQWKLKYTRRQNDEGS